MIAIYKCRMCGKTFEEGGVYLDKIPTGAVCVQHKCPTLENMWGAGDLVGAYEVEGEQKDPEWFGKV